MRGTVMRSVIRLGWWLVAVVLVWGVVGCDQGQPAADPVDPDVGPSTTVEVEVFFANPDLGDPCGEVFPVIREVDADDPVVGALEALLAGPTAAEQAQGYGGWFSQDTVEMLLDVEVVDATVRVVFKDLRLVIPNASSSCGSAGLLAQLDATLLAFDHLGSTRYALADQAAFYEWLQLADPDTTPPEQATEPDTTPPEQATEPDDGPAIDLDAGWTPVSGFASPVYPGCCGAPITGPASPEGFLPSDGWPADGFYDVEVVRTAASPTILELTIRRWEAMDELPEMWEGISDVIDRDPTEAIHRQIPIDHLAVTLIPITDFDTVGSVSLVGEPGAFATLLSDGIDPAYREWIYEPHLAGTGPGFWQDLLVRSKDPTFPFGMDYCGEPVPCGPIAYRGPHGSSLRADWTGLSGDDRGHWPPGPEGLYGWNMVTLEIRDGEPILYVWAGEIAG
jgi:hypothetical protein